MKPVINELQDARVLIVDDTPANIDLLALVLEPDGYRLSFATSGERALVLCAQVKPEVVLLDVMMPGMDGFETCEKLCVIAGDLPMPIIFVTAKDETMDLVRGFNAGAVDYLTKPIRKEEVRARVRTHLINSRLLRQRDELYRQQKEQTESIRIILNNIAEAIFMLDGDGKFQMANAAAERLLGQYPGGLLGRQFSDLLAPKIAIEYQQLMNNWKTQGAMESMVSDGPRAISMLAANGDFREVDLSLCGMPVSRQLYIGIIHDLESHKIVTHELRRQLRIDPLTQLANRRAFDEVLNREWRNSLERQTPLTIVMIDIDYFKAYNDHLGHQQGDLCLRQVALAIRLGAAKPGSLAVRYGGEEFTLVLPDTDTDAALRTVIQVQKAVEELAIAHPGSEVSPLVTLSMGIVSRIAQTDLSADKMVNDADAMLYEAKSTGRNRYVVFSMKS